MSWHLTFLKHNKIKTTFVPRGFITLDLGPELNKPGEEEWSKNFV